MWPDATVRAELNRCGAWLHRHWGGRRMRADTLHLTLAFIGNVPVETRDRLPGALRPPSTEPFTLTLDTPGCWRHNRVGWLAPQPRPALETLVAGLRVNLEALAIPFDPKPFAAHVTLLRNTQGGELPPCRPITWPVADFALIESRPDEHGAHYEVLQRWPLDVARKGDGLG